MGLWTKTRNRVTKKVEKEVKRIDEDINAELRRFRNRLATANDQGSPAADSCQPQVKAPELVVVTTIENPPNDINQNVSAAPSTTVVTRIDEVTSLPVNFNPLGLKPGLGFIINHKTFEDEELLERCGSELDVKRMEEVLASFHISSKSIHDGTISDVKSLMSEVEEFNFTSYSCLILVIMSHGHECNEISAKDGKYSLHNDVLYPILRNPTLVGKTKMLFVQSCKGLTNLVYATDSRKAVGQPTKTPDEILQFYSCVEGYVSYLMPTGSIFIEILCDKLAALGETEDIRVICNTVIEIVKEDIYDMQIPMLHTNLTKPFVLGHYKKREISES